MHGLACHLPLPSHHQPQEECAQSTQVKKEKKRAADRNLKCMLTQIPSS